jgi:hypothetical protein
LEPGRIVTHTLIHEDPPHSRNPTRHRLWRKSPKHNPDQPHFKRPNSSETEPVHAAVPVLPWDGARSIRPGELQITRFRIDQLLFSMHPSAAEAVKVHDQMLESSSAYRFVSSGWCILSHTLYDIGYSLWLHASRSPSSLSTLSLRKHVCLDIQP